MKITKSFCIALTLAMLCSLPSCSQKITAKPGNGGDKASGNGPFGMESMSNSGNSEKTMKITAENAVDLSLLTGDEKSLSEVQVEDTLYLNLSNLTYGQNSSASQVLAIGEKAELNENISLEAEASDAAGTYIKVTSEESAVKIVLSGTLEKGSVEIEPKKNSSLVLELNSASITSVNYAPINVSKAAATYLVLTGNNTLKDGRVYGTGYSKSEGTDYYTSSFSGTAEDGAELTEKWAQGKDTKASLYTKGSLIISGEGNLTVNEEYKHGIYAKDYIHVLSGTITVNTSGRNCIRSQNGFVMEGGTLNLNGTGTHTNDQSRGIIVEGDEENPGEGFIYISDGTVNINTTGRAISAKWDIEEDAGTDTTDDDPNPVVVITGGTFSITTSASVIEDEWSQNVTYHDVDGIEVTEKESCSPEGIEGKLGVVISGGTFDINTTDDSINASRDGDGYVNISGGKIYASSSKGDCIDSNGDINISGGTIVALSTLGSEDGFDCDGDLTFTGGLAVGVSGSSRVYASTSNKNNTQNVFVLGSSVTGSAGTTMAVEDSSGNPVFAFTIPSGLSYGLVVISSPNLELGKTYSVKSAVNVSGGQNFHGLYTVMPSVSGGSGDTEIKTESGTLVYNEGVSEGGFGGFGEFGMGDPRSADGFPGGDFKPGEMPPDFNPDNFPGGDFKPGDFPPDMNGNRPERPNGDMKGGKEGNKKTR